MPPKYRKYKSPMMEYRARKIRADNYADFNKKKRASGYVRATTVKAVANAIVDRAAEKKENHVYISQTDMVTSGFYLLNGIATGDTEITRDGTRIRMTRLNYDVMITARTTSTIPNFGWWAIVLDRQANSADPTVVGVYDTTVVTDQAIAPRNNANLDRYQVLKRVDWTTNTVAGGDTGYKWRGSLDLKLSLPDPKDQEVRYNGATSAIASLRTNGLYLMYAVSGQSGFADAANYNRFSAGMCLKFTDV